MNCKIATNSMGIQLSICIATYKRAAFITNTIDSIINQIKPNVEIVIVDGNSPDNTAEVIAPYVKKYPFVKYYQESENSGVDGDYDKCVSYAAGEYCWLMTDDDIILENAVELILSKCNSVNDLVVVNACVRDYQLSTVYEKTLLKLSNNESYSAATINLFYENCIRYLSFIGGVVVKRDFWLSRDRKTYYGTAFIHIGVLLQQPVPNNISVIAQPLIAIRYGNAMWKPQTFNIWMLNWPTLINSFKHIPQKVSAKITQGDFMGTIKQLIIYRALGCYSYRLFLQYSLSNNLISYVLHFFISITPTWLMNSMLSVSLYLLKPKSEMLIYDLATTKVATTITRLIAKKLKIVE